MKTAFLIIDMQRGFFTTPEQQNGLEETVKNIWALCSHFNATSQPVYMVKTVHQPDHSTWTLKMQERGEEYLTADGKQADVIPELQGVSYTSELIKTRDSAFYATDLEGRLRTSGVNYIVLAGTATHTCIFQTAAAAYARNFKVAIVLDGVISHQPDLARAALRLLKVEYDIASKPAAAFI